MRTAIVLAGGDAIDARRLDEIKAALPAGALVVAADSGVDLAAPLGLRVDRVVGDLDSADPDVVEAARRAGAIVDVHPVDKDATDLELALLAAADSGASDIVVVGGAGGRTDHFLANVLLLAAPRFAACVIHAHLGDAWLAVARGGRPPLPIRGTPGSIVTLLPVAGGAGGVVTTGLRYPLAGDELATGTSRGVSNVMVGTDATVALATGTLLVVQPDAGRSPS